MPTHDTETLAVIIRAHQRGFRERRPPFYCTGCDWTAVVVADGRDADGVSVDDQHREHVIALVAVVAAQAKAEALAPVLALADQWEQDGGAEPFAWEALRAVSSVPQATEPTHTNKEERR